MHRYDARLLLDALPDFEPPPGPTLAHPRPSSPSGWSDLPSDTDETFFFSPEEASDFKNEKRRRLLEQAHEERVKARLEEEKAQETVDDDPWGGSDEEVSYSGALTQFMCSSLCCSPMMLRKNSCTGRQPIYFHPPTPLSLRCGSSRTMAQINGLPS